MLKYIEGNDENNRLLLEELEELDRMYEEAAELAEQWANEECDEESAWYEELNRGYAQDRI